MNLRRKNAKETAATKDSGVICWCFAILAAIIFEGALRKWLLPPALQIAAYAAKDVLAAVFVIKYPLWRQARPDVFSVRIWILLAAALLVPALIMGLMLAPAAALMTLKNAVLWPLFAVHLAARLNSRMIDTLCRALSITACAVAVLALVQFALPENHPLNAYAWNSTGIATEPAMMPGGHVRATGTFSYLTGLASFGAFGFAWCLWRYVSSKRPGIRSWSTAGMAASLVCILTSGSRGPLVVCVLSAIGITVALRRFKLLFQFAAITLLLTGVFWLIPDKSFVASYIERVNTAEDTFEQRAVDPLFSFVKVLTDDPVGVGLGQDSQAIVFSESTSEGRWTIHQDEDVRSRAATEAGVLGILSLFTVVILCFRQCVLGVGSLNPEARAAAGALGFVITCQVFQCMWFDHVGCALWWFAAAAWLSMRVGVRSPYRSVRWRGLYPRRIPAA